MSKQRFNNFWGTLGSNAFTSTTYQPQLNGTGFVKASGTTISYDNSTYLTTISGISAGGDLTGTYPSPTLVATGTAGTWGGSLTAISITTDSKGRVTAVTPVAIPQGTVTSITAGGYSTGGTITGSGTITPDTSAGKLATKTDLISYMPVATNNAISTTTYTLLSSDKGKILSFTSSSAVTLTVPSSLGSTFFCTIQQMAAGQVTFSAGGGVTLRVYPSGVTKTAGQYAQVQLNFTNTTDTYALQGAMQ